MTPTPIATAPTSVNGNRPKKEKTIYGRHTISHFPWTILAMALALLRIATGFMMQHTSPEDLSYVASPFLFVGFCTKIYYLVEDIGEQDASAFTSNSLECSFANATGGLLIRWEHRYYGGSKPIVQDADTVSDNNTAKLAEYFKYHTIEQALEDVVVFAKQFQYKNQDLSSAVAPWVFSGASYPGARAAWIRVRNPEVIFASFAGSAPVETSMENPEYFDTYLKYVLHYASFLLKLFPQMP